MLKSNCSGLQSGIVHSPRITAVYSDGGDAIRWTPACYAIACKRISSSCGMQSPEDLQFSLSIAAIREVLHDTARAADILPDTMAEQQRSGCPGPSGLQQHRGAVRAHPCTALWLVWRLPSRCFGR